MQKISSFISWVFLPLFTPLYALAIALYLPINASSFVMNDSLHLLHPKVKFLFFLLFSIFIVIAPSFSLFVMKKNGMIQSFELENREERNSPIAVTMLYCLILFFFLHFQAEGAYIPPILKAMVLGGGAAAGIAYLINKFMKISLHGIGMGAFFGFIYMFSLRLEEIPLFLMISILLLGGIVMSARLILNAHTLKEVGYGYLLGFSTQLICILFYM
ncbi:MAG TPA: hypothetical protein VKX31_09710 [Brumimicrobium sp.]|nr:hypothetical protein [Brumimicrobium sp.]